jgi:hypothetical protein
MVDEITTPMIAIAGGFVLLFALLCILWRSRRRYVDRSSPENRRTSFHFVVNIDPAIAEHGRAAWERSPSDADHQVHEVADDHLIEVVDIPLPAPQPPQVDDYTSIGYAPVPPPSRPYDYRVQRFARGSTPAISHPAPHYMPQQQMAARPRDWDVPAAPSVTARMRATRRG